MRSPPLQLASCPSILTPKKTNAQSILLDHEHRHNHHLHHVMHEVATAEELHHKEEALRILEGGVQPSKEPGGRSEMSMMARMVMMMMMTIMIAIMICNNNDVYFL